MPGMSDLETEEKPTMLLWVEQKKGNAYQKKEGGTQTSVEDWRENRYAVNPSKESGMSKRRR